MGAVVFSQYFLSISFQNLVVLEQKIEKAKKKKISDTLKLSNICIYIYIKRRRGYGCNLIKKEEYKYILGVSIPTLHKTFRIFNNRLQNLLKGKAQQPWHLSGKWLRAIVLKKIVRSI